MEFYTLIEDIVNKFDKTAKITEFSCNYESKYLTNLIKKSLV